MKVVVFHSFILNLASKLCEFFSFKAYCFRFPFSAPSDASTVSLAESRASVLPNYDEVSLNHRNAAANKMPPSGTNQTAVKPEGQRSSKSPHIPSNNQEKLVDQGGQFYESVDVVSNVPKGPEQPSAKPSRQQHDHNVYSSLNKNPVYDEVERQQSSNASVNESPVYDEVEGSDKVDTFQALSVNDPVMNAIPRNPKSATLYQGNEMTKSIYDESSPQYAVLEDSKTNYSNEDVNNKEQKTQHNGKQMQCSPKQTSTWDSPTYAVLENPNDNLPNDNDADQKQESYSLKEQEQGLPSDDNQQETDPLTAVAVESPPSEKYITVLPPTPPKQNGVPSENTGLLESLESSDQMSPVGKSADKSRTVRLN